ncbi:hypothetical protein ACI2JA_01430 [Alkalihalobacillus sp. NPDC078783]
MVTSKRHRVADVLGFGAFLVAIVNLILINFVVLTSTSGGSTFMFYSPVYGLVLGMVSLLFKRRRNVFAMWGMFLCLFLIVFTFLMFGLSWTINPRI